MPSAASLGAGVEDESARRGGLGQPVDRIAAARRVRVAGGGEHERDRGAREGRDAPIGDHARAEGRSQVTTRGGQQERAERDRQARQDRLRLRVTEPGVELEQDGAALGEDQPRVERAVERRTTPSQLGEHRPVDAARSELASSSSRSANGL